MLQQSALFRTNNFTLLFGKFTDFNCKHNKDMVKKSCLILLPGQNQVCRKQNDIIWDNFFCLGQKFGQRQDEKKGLLMTGSIKP